MKPNPSPHRAQARNSYRPNRAERRRAQKLSRKQKTGRDFDRELRALIERDGDNCSICRAFLTHNTRTFSGYRGDEIALVGECCVGKLDTLCTMGVISHRPHSALSRPSVGDAPRDYSWEEMHDGVAAFQKIISEMDRIADDAARRAGLPRGSKQILNNTDTTWGDDDRLWFEAHPARTHRLRRLFPGETFKGCEPDSPGRDTCWR